MTRPAELSGPGMTEARQMQQRAVDSYLIKLTEPGLEDKLVDLKAKLPAAIRAKKTQSEPGKVLIHVDTVSIAPITAGEMRELGIYVARFIPDTAVLTIPDGKPTFMWTEGYPLRAPEAPEPKPEKPKLNPETQKALEDLLRKKREEEGGDVQPA